MTNRNQGLVRRLRPAEDGFSVVELSITALLMLMVLLVGGMFFQTNAEVATIEVMKSDMQQSARSGMREVMRLTRMSGRGGLPTQIAPAGAFAGRLMPRGAALEVINATAADAHLVPADDTTPRVLEDTDQLVVRGVFSSPVYQVSPVASDTLVLDDIANPTTGSITVYDPNPVLSIPQDLRPLKETLDSARPEALILNSPLSGIFAVVQVTGGTVLATGDGDKPIALRVDFRVGGTDHANGYASLSTGGGFPTALQRLASVSILEEYHFYVRESHTLAADLTSELRPRLSRARFYPGTDLPWNGDVANLRQDVAENVLDFQLVLGIDTNSDLVLQDDEPSAQDDDWLYDDADDRDSDGPKWQGVDPSSPPRLYFLRATALTRTERPERGYLSPRIVEIEDHDYSESMGAMSDAERRGRSFHRLEMTSTMDLRNL